MNCLFSKDQVKFIWILILYSIILSIPIHTQTHTPFFLFWGAFPAVLTPLCVFCAFVSYPCFVYSQPATSKPSHPQRDDTSAQNTSRFSLLIKTLPHLLTTLTCLWTVHISACLLSSHQTRSLSVLQRVSLSPCLVLPRSSKLALVIHSLCLVHYLKNNRPHITMII